MYVIQHTPLGACIYLPHFLLYELSFQLFIHVEFTDVTLSVTRQRFSPPLEDLLLRMLIKDPDERISIAEMKVKKLEKCIYSVVFGILYGICYIRCMLYSERNIAICIVYILCIYSGASLVN